MSCVILHNYSTCFPAWPEPNSTHDFWILAFSCVLGSVCGRLLLPSSPWHSLHAWDPGRVRLSLMDGHGPFPGSERAPCAMCFHVASRFESPNLVAVWQDGACRDFCGASGEKFGRKRWKLATVWLFRMGQEHALLNGMERLVFLGWNSLHFSMA